MVQGLGCMVGRRALTSLVQTASRVWLLQHGSGVGMKEADVALVQKLVINLTGQPIHLFAVQMHGDPDVVRQHFEKHHVLSVL